MKQIRTFFIEWTERRVDKLLVTVGESLKILVQEGWRFFFRVFVFFVSILLGFVHKPSFEKWAQEHRHRIQPIFVDATENSETVPTTFAELVEGNESSSSEDDIARVAFGDDRLSPASRRSNSKRRLKYEKVVLNKDRVFSSQKINTGILEDIRLKTLLKIDSLVRSTRISFKRFFRGAKGLTLWGSIKYIIRKIFRIMISFLHPARIIVGIIAFIFRVTYNVFAVFINLPAALKGFVTSYPVDLRTTEAIVTSLGYPYEAYDVVTEDGYILRLERLPKKDSTKVLYFQHGVVDNSFAWFGHTEGETGSALAFRAFDSGYDIWVGSLRGCGSSMSHSNKDLPYHEYWNFTVNEHAFEDLPAFVRKIREVKDAELSAAKLSEMDDPAPTPGESQSELSPQYNLTFVAHSMGAMATLMYITYSKMKGLDHGISSAILLSPAGLHKTAPKVVPILGPIINATINIFPWLHTFRFPSMTLRMLSAKLIEDLNASYTGRMFLSWSASKVIGGNAEDHTFLNTHNLTYNVFTGTSKGIFKHFWQNWKHQKFEAYDYGPEKNIKMYGTATPIDFMENYDKIDIPVYFVMGLTDTLIEPVSIVAQYAALKDPKPELAFLKAFPRVGHIDFTVGANESLISFMLETLDEWNQGGCSGESKTSRRVFSRKEATSQPKRIMDPVDVYK